jgi:hypothetical protein
VLSIIEDRIEAFQLAIVLGAATFATRLIGVDFGAEFDIELRVALL